MSCVKVQRDYHLNVEIMAWNILMNHLHTATGEKRSIILCKKKGVINLVEEALSE